MTQQEIKETIDKNNRRIEAIFNPTVFMLDEEIKELLEINENLRKQCNHEYDSNGMCIYCYEKEEN